MQSLFEKYRPHSVADLIGQPKTVNALTMLRNRAGTYGGNAYFLEGGSGTGKTTLARIMAEDLADDLYITETDARDVGVDFVRQMERDMCFRAMGKGGRAWIINEADDLSAAALARLKTALEPRDGIPSYVAIIFTCTKESAGLLWEDSEDAPQFLSRCLGYSLTSKGLADLFAARALEIARAEDLDNGKPLAAFKRLVMDARNNMRMVLSRIQAGAMFASNAA